MGRDEKGGKRKASEGKGREDKGMAGKGRETKRRETQGEGKVKAKALGKPLGKGKAS